MIRIAKQTFVLGAVALAAACTQPAPEPITLETPRPPAIKRFDAAASRVQAGETTTLTWEIEDAETISLEELGSGPIAGVGSTQLSGAASVTVKRDVVFLLTATGAGGMDQRAAAVFTNEGAGSLMLTAVPNRIRAGESASLVWSAPQGSGAALEDGQGETLTLDPAASTGVIALSPHSTTRYTLRVGSRSVSADVHVSPAIHEFVASDGPHLPNQELTLSWQTLGGTGVSISALGRGTIHVADADQVKSGTFTDLIPSSVPLNSHLDYALRVEDGSTFHESLLRVYVGVNPQIERFTVPPYAKRGTPLTLNFDWKLQSADTVDVFVNDAHVFRTTDPQRVRDGSVIGYQPASSQEDIVVELRATNALGGVSTVRKIVEVLDSPSIDPLDGFYFEAVEAQPVQGGLPVTIRWQVPDSRSLTVRDAKGTIVATRSGLEAESDSVVLYPNADQVYTLTANNTLGDQVTASLQLAVSPVFLNVRNHNGTFVEGARTALHADALPAPAASKIYLRTKGYTFERHHGSSFVDISGTGNRLEFVADKTKPANDDGLAVFTADFTTKIFGHEVSANQGVTVSTNGFFTFGPVESSTFVSFTGTTVKPFSVGALGIDLEILSGGGVHWEIVGSGEEERLIVQWTKMKSNSYAGAFSDAQVQMYRSGDIVLDYRNIVGDQGLVFAGLRGATSAEGIKAAEMVGPGAIANDVRYVLGTVPLDLPVTVVTEHPGRYEFLVKRGDSLMPIHYEMERVIRPGDLVISEAMYFPEARWTAGEWIEIQNRTARSIDLDGFTLSSKSTSVTLDAATMGTTVVPASGVLLLAQSALPAENGELSPAPALIYGKNTLQMNKVQDELVLAKNGIEAVRLDYQEALANHGGPSISVMYDYGPFLAASGTAMTSAYCEPTAVLTYGTTAPQRGTPGRIQACDTFTLKAIAPGLTDIVAMGVGEPVFAPGYTDNQVATVTLPVPFTYAWQSPPETSTIRVGVNGYLTLNTTGTITATYAMADATPTTALPNAFVAIFGEDMIAKVGEPLSNVFTHRFEMGQDPNAAPDAPGRFVVQWNRMTPDASNPEDTMTFQVKLIDGGRIEFHYGEIIDGDATKRYARGQSANVWIENGAGNRAIPIHTHSRGGNGIDPWTSYAFSIDG